MTTVGAVDIGATKTLIGLADRYGQLKPDATVRILTPDTPEQLITAVTARLRDLSEACGLSAIGCAAPGALDLAAGTMLRFHNRSWPEVALASLLSDRLQAPVFLQDDATSAALGEATFGAGAGLDPLAYVTVSSGVGAGLVLAGQPLAGAHALAGEIGHLVINPLGPPCSCGRRGDIESYSGGIALARQAIALWPADPLPDGNPAPRDAAAIFALADLGDPRALEVTSASAHAIAFALAAIAVTVDPARIVLGGAVALSQSAWIRDVIVRARALCWSDAGTLLDICPASLGESSALVGAAVLAARQLSTRDSHLVMDIDVDA